VAIAHRVKSVPPVAKRDHYAGDFSKGQTGSRFISDGWATGAQHAAPLQGLRGECVSDVARFLPSSDQSLIVYFDEEISLEAHERVVKLLRLLEREPLAAVRNVHPGYSSVLVKFDALRNTHADIERVLRGYLVRLEDVRTEAARVVEIPVCYGGEFGPDLAEVCALHGLTREEIVERHSAAEYLVYFLGFVPGFGYLGRAEDGGAHPGIPFTPRLTVPRKRVPVGSVGIAGEQTGVYPFATPGGWRLIGRTAMAMFRAKPRARSVLAIGDRVRFRAITSEEFAEMERLAQ
jgi:KipI family sensor histidine kinase inhibitor